MKNVVVQLKLSTAKQVKALNDWFTYGRSIPFEDRGNKYIALVESVAYDFKHNKSDIKVHVRVLIELIAPMKPMVEAATVQHIVSQYIHQEVIS